MVTHPPARPCASALLQNLSMMRQYFAHVGVLCVSIVVGLDVDVCTVGLLGAAQPQVVPPTSQCNSRVGRLECQTHVYLYILKGKLQLACQFNLLLSVYVCVCAVISVGCRVGCVGCRVD